MGNSHNFDRGRTADRQAWEAMSAASRLGAVGLTAVSLSASAITFYEFRFGSHMAARVFLIAAALLFWDFAFPGPLNSLYAGVITAVREFTGRSMPPCQKYPQSRQ